METKMEAIREGYGRGVINIAKKDPNVVFLDADLAMSTKSIKAKEVDPERHFYSGISEQAMIGEAVGLALTGKKVFASTFAIFLSRAFEPIRQSICYGNVPVKLVGSHSGVHVGEDGPSAQMTEDISIMRALPNMNVIVASDSVEAEKATEFLLDFDKPCYLRTGRNKVPVLHSDNYKFEFGKANVLKNGNDATIIACGVMVSIALEAAELLKKENISLRVINMHTIKPLDKKTVVNASKETKAILTAEDHQINGGLGSAVAEVLAEKNLNVNFARIGMNNSFAESGKPDELFEKYGFTAKHLAEKVKTLL